MKPQILGLRVGGAVFGLMSLVQLFRLWVQPEVIVNGHVVPLWPSVLAAVVLGSLSLWLLGLAHTATIRLHALRSS